MRVTVHGEEEHEPAAGHGHGHAHGHDHAHPHEHAHAHAHHHATDVYKRQVQISTWLGIEATWLASTCKSVSYTHLDVYKRQAAG